jgi:molybdenum cofactor cytidylyltransferase
VNEIIIVTGKFVPQCRSSITSGKVQWVPNPDYTLGMSSSIKKGIEQVSASADAVFITPADIPFFTAATVQRMIKAFSPDTIVIPVCRDKKGHPVLLDKRFIEPCLQEQGEKILYEVIAKNTDAINYLPVEDEGILMDLDTIEDYEALKRYYDTFNDPMTK